MWWWNFDKALKKVGFWLGTCTNVGSLCTHCGWDGNECIWKEMGWIGILFLGRSARQSTISIDIEYNLAGKHPDVNIKSAFDNSVFNCWQHQTFAKIELLETNWGTKCWHILVKVPKTSSAYLLGVVGWLYLVSAWETSYLNWCMWWSIWGCKERAVPEQISGISRHISRRWSVADHLQSWLWSKRVWKKLNGPVFKAVSRRRCRYEIQKATKDLKYFVDSIWR